MINKFKELLKILSKKQKLQFFSCIILYSINALLDITAIASVYPIFSILTDGNYISNNFYLSLIRDNYFLNDNGFIIFLILFCCFIIILSTASRVFSRWYTLKYSEELLYYFSTKLFSYYLNMPLKFYLDKNNSDLMQRITVQVNSTVSGFITPILLIINNIFSAFILIIALILYKPILSLFLFLSVISFYFFIIRYLKLYVNKIGKILPLYSSKSAKIIIDAFNSIREVKIKNRLEFFNKQFIEIANKFKNSHIQMNLFNNLPGALLEIFSFVLILLLCLYFYLYDNGLVAMIPTLAVIAMSLRRLLPSIQEIYQNIVMIKFYEPSYEVIKADIFNMGKKIKSEKSDLQEKLITLKQIDSIKFENISFQYDKSNTENLININLDIYNNNFIGLIGKSGSGKTTFIDLVSGLLSPTKGCIYFNETSFQKINLSNIENLIGYSSQNNFLIDDTIEKNIVLDEKINYEKLKEITKLVKIDKFINTLEGGLKTKIGENGILVSGGQKQRILLARAIYDSPKILILDEATNAIDINLEKEILYDLKKKFKDKIVIYITHRLTSLEICDKVYLLEKSTLKELPKNEDYNKYFK